MAKRSTSTTKSELYQRIYQVVSQIPFGQVGTYGQIASILKLSGGARQVGYALFVLPADSEVPWHRVINAQGRISSRGDTRWEQRQRELLEAEEVVLDDLGRISLNDYRCENLF